MATLKIAYGLRQPAKVVLASDEAITITIAYWPKVEVVLIVATPTVAARRRFAAVI